MNARALIALLIYCTPGIALVIALALALYAGFTR